jgi:hypothetical protein
VLPATAAVVLGPIAWFSGLVLFEANFWRHVAITVIFAAVSVIGGWRVQTTGRGRPGTRICGWIGLVTGALGFGMMLYQLLSLATHGVVPAPFWAPFLGQN